MSNKKKSETKKTFLNPRKIWILLKFLWILTLISISSWWILQATIKYYNQPTSTQISQLYGEIEGGKISFPYITICNFDFAKDNEYLNECRLDLINFYIQ